MANSLAWQDLNSSHTTEYLSLTKKEDCLQYITKLLGLGKDNKSLIIRDLYYYLLEFTKKSGFKKQQISVCFSIFKKLDEQVRNTDVMNVDKDFHYFKKLLLEHSVDRPPMSVKLFGMQEVMLITEYAVNTYFRNYLLYKYAFTKKVKLQLVIENFMPVAQPLAEPPACQVVEEVSTVAATEPVVEIQAKVPSIPSETEEPQVEEASPFNSSDPIEEIQQTAPRSQKHENAVAELKSYISSVLQVKLDEIKQTVASKIADQEQSQKAKVEDPEKKKPAPAKAKK